jgi:cellulose synthase/poly-beta-1,6-N-acetylglucosamine synthase-like glycosyltransferase
MALRVVGLAVGWGVALLWTTRASAWLRGISRLPNLLELAPAPARGSVTVIVPARNEGPGVAAGLRSLLASKGVDLEVIAVDDRSTDDTGAAMDALQTDALEQEVRASRVRYAVEHVDELPAGWLGKPHAMACGAALATGEWLLFTDADVVFAEDTLARALSYIEREGGDHLLVVPTVVAQSAGEAMMLPFLHVLSIWGPRLWRVADPQSRDAVGVGAFNLMRRSTYEAVGGWERLRMEVIEDLRMGYLIKRAGFASRVVTGYNLVRIRWAHGAWGVVTNLTKNVFAAFRFRIGLMVGGTVATAIMSLLPFAGLVLGIALDRAWLWPSVVSLAALTALYWRYRRFADPSGTPRVLWLVAFPAAALVFIYAMVRSMVLTLVRGGVVWRGTFYPLRELRAHAGPLR